MSLDWQPTEDESGVTVTLNEYRVIEFVVVPIDEDEQRIIDRYDTRRYQEDSDHFVFYAQWRDGEWQPRSTHPTLDGAKEYAEKWWSEYTYEEERR